MFILVDENDIIRCMASEECNLHEDKLYMAKTEIDDNIISGFTVGDEYRKGVCIKRPENYPLPSNEDLIDEEEAKLVRQQAIDNLKASGVLPQEYIDSLIKLL